MASPQNSSEPGRICGNHASTQNQERRWPPLPHPHSLVRAAAASSRRCRFLRSGDSSAKGGIIISCPIAVVIASAVSPVADTGAGIPAVSAAAAVSIISISIAISISISAAAITITAAVTPTVTSSTMIAATHIFESPSI